MSDEVKEAPQVVEAEIIDDAEPSSELVVSMRPMAAIDANYEAVKAYVDNELKKYAVWDIGTDADYKLAKNDRAELRKMIARIKDKKSEVHSVVMAPLREFDYRIDSILDAANKLEQDMKEPIDACDERFRNALSARLRKHAEEYAPALFCPLDGQQKPLVDYGRISDPKWLNRSYGEVKAQQELEAIVNKIAGDEKAIEAMHLPHEAEAKAVYFATLDFSAAVKRNTDLCENEERERALEQARREAQEARMREMAENAASQALEESGYSAEIRDECAAVGMTPEQVFAQPKASEPETVAKPEPITRDVTMCFYAVTDAQVEGIKDYCRSNGIHGRVM